MSDFGGYGEFGSGWRARKGNPVAGQEKVLNALGGFGLGKWIDENIVERLIPRGSAVPRGESGEDFDAWYRGVAAKYGLPPNPEQADYDYRKAFEEGVREPIGGAWPDKYRRNRFQ